ncbi:gamma-interferon-inducible lysosomal thiol reductase [Plakobranchus ocellatus]|uniref:Gamma-interferon-inducible lysosomal thiol reductase n=1 Tax=Plakobranchus ocellatus TaxID=259542 RepID=A0AAV3Z229_9GAST|nr:gamma-interferon-inducible lysosomal thiol reductase [Plakobranchus ocellatus]
MATTTKTAVFLVLLSTFLSASLAFKPDGCNIPSRFWCENKDVALRCGVLDQCKQFEWTDAADKVELALYYESLCPDCQGFITGTLFPNFAKLSSIMNLTLVPYGNAYERRDHDKWIFDCQHGEQECIGNLIETCTIALVGDVNKYFPFINCMEASELKPADAAEKCASKFPVPLENIMNCSKSDYGNELEHKMALKTNALQPPHRYVPWVTINGIHTEAIEKEAESDLVKLICDTYKVSINRV